MSRSQLVRHRSAILIQVGLIASLLLMIGLFSVQWTAPEAAIPPPTPQEGIKIVVVPVPATDLRPPPPPQPPPPIAVDDVEIGEEIDELPEWEIIEDRTPPPGLPDLPPLTTPEPEEEPDLPLDVAEIMPEPVGGLAGIQRRLRYPELARRAGIEGMVYVQFVVDERGQVSDLVCLRDPGGGTCEAAMDAIRATEFTPGRQRGRAVKVRFSIPVRFRLN